MYMPIFKVKQKIRNLNLYQMPLKFNTGNKTKITGDNAVQLFEGTGKCVYFVNWLSGLFVCCFMPYYFSYIMGVM